MITCLICNKELSILCSHLKRIHKISKEDYVLKFPGAQIISEEETLRRSNSNYKLWASRTEEEKSKSGKIRRQGWTNESYINMVQSKLSYYQTLSSEERIKLFEKMNTMSIDFHNSPKYEANRLVRNNHISEGHLRNVQRDPSQYVKRMLDANSKMHYWLRTCSEDELNSFLKRSFLRPPKRFTFEYKGKAYQVRSSYEKLVLKVLVDFNLNFKYEVCLKRPDGRRYIADFIVEDKLCLEPKSIYYVEAQGGEYDLGMKKLAAENKNYKFVLLTEAEIFKCNLKEIIRSLCHECGIQIKESVMI